MRPARLCPAKEESGLGAPVHGHSGVWRTIKRKETIKHSAISYRQKLPACNLVARS